MSMNTTRSVGREVNSASVLNCSSGPGGRGITYVGAAVHPPQPLVECLGTLAGSDAMSTADMVLHRRPFVQ